MNGIVIVQRDLGPEIMYLWSSPYLVVPKGCAMETLVGIFASIERAKETNERKGDVA